MNLDYLLSYSNLLLLMIKRSNAVSTFSLQQNLFNAKDDILQALQENHETDEELLNYFEKPLLEEEMLRDRWGEPS